MVWKAYIQINALDSSSFFIEQFKISDEQYKILMKAVEDNIPIIDLDVYDEIYDLAEASADYQKMIDRWPGVESKDECTLADVKVYDPGDWDRFKQYYIGRPLEEDAFFEIDEDDYRFVTYSVDINTEDGKISDLSLGICAIELFGFRRNYDSNDAYPDYSFLKRELDKRLNYSE